MQLELTITTMEMQAFHQGGRWDEVSFRHTPCWICRPVPSQQQVYHLIHSCKPNFVALSHTDLHHRQIDLIRLKISRHSDMVTLCFKVLSTMYYGFAL